jgi:hypothetical protein
MGESRLGEPVALEVLLATTTALVRCNVSLETL